MYLLSLVRINIVYLYRKKRCRRVGVSKNGTQTDMVLSNLPRLYNFNRCITLQFFVV